MKTQIEKRNSKSGKRKQNPVAPARGDSRPTIPDGAARHPYQRKELVAILEEYGVSVHGFDGLRRDSYEKHLAGRSLVELEGFYGTLFTSCEVYGKIQKQCPAWGAGSRRPGKLPSIKTLTEIRERIRLERRLADVSGHFKAFQTVAESLTGLPVAERAAALQGLQALIAAELMGLTIEGGKVLDHLPAVDRVIRAASAQARGENMEARAKLDVERLRLQEKALEIQNEKLKADDRRQKNKELEMKRKAEAQLDKDQSSDRPDAEAEGDEESGMTEDEKSAALLERAFGKPPADLDFTPYEAHLKDNDEPQPIQPS